MWAVMVIDPAHNDRWFLTPENEFAMGDVFEYFRRGTNRVFRVERVDRGIRVENADTVVRVAEIA